ncbi:unnamed protein product [Penicillium olsonii]|uniref:RNA helicase n=1 Tax=Penicillium olsonii TaxID=99116 RepID=A0A9W4N8F3_PENOL|nr:unnamed protein product [Penicillium olsonii]CAG8296395.1 unnamed protein product [Penicillium olsonii]
MDSFGDDVPEAASATAASVAGSAPVQEDVAAGVLSGIGPNAESAGQIARDKGWTDPVPFAYSELTSKEHRDWAGVAARYEWDDEYGEVGPSHPELEEQLFRGNLIPRAGSKLGDLNSFKVNVESPNEIKAVVDWKDFGLHPVMLQNIALCQYDRPTAIQSYAIPAVLSNQDLIAVAQTGKPRAELHEPRILIDVGSGKTGAFLIPILSKLMGKAKRLAAPRPNITQGFDFARDAVRAEPLVLVVCPTRELATQIFDDARRLCYRSMLRPCVVYGGAPTRAQREELQKGCDILIATPGRLLDFMEQTHVLSLRRVRYTISRITPRALKLTSYRYTVVDEADEMLDSDWEDEFKRIMSGGDLNEDGDHRYMMFSATFNKEFRKLAKDYLSDDHVRLRVGRAGSSHRNVVQDIVWADQHQKMKALYDLLISMPPVRTLVFVNSKDQVDFVDDYLYNSSMPSTSIHSGRTQLEREDAIRSFRSAKCPIMVATGVTARGLDVINVLHVVNFDLPSTLHGGITEYIHRIGRTARIGNEGIATSFYNERNEELAPDLVKILMECKQNIPDFLESFRPENDELVFDDNSEDEFFDKPEEDTGLGSDAGGGAEAGDEAGAEPVEAEGENQPLAESEQDPFVDSKKAKPSKNKVDDWDDMEVESRPSKGGLSGSSWASKAPKASATTDFWDSAPKKADQSW